MYTYKPEWCRVPIKVWSGEGTIEQGALDQIENAASLRFVFKHAALMPDAHQGIGVSIGSVVATEQVVVPSIVGTDIGCGMVAVKTSLVEIDTETIKVIMGKTRQVVPVGFNHQKDNQQWIGFDSAPDIPIIQKELNSARKQLSTLGSGNHFLEIQRGNDGHIWIMIHSGSRNFGFQTANVYHKIAQKLCEQWNSDLPDKDLAFLPMDSKEGQEYFVAMNYCLDFAKANRALMMERVTDIFQEVCGATIEDKINIHHNYAAMENHFGKNVLVHRKGATKANKGLRGIIPGSMGTHSYIVEGLGNEDSFQSCSHGAGRRMGRKEAKRTLNLEEEQVKMTGIVHGLRTKDELDEAPGSYKDIDAVMENQVNLVKPIVTLTPLGVIKG